MGTGSEWALRCMLLVAWSASSSNRGSEAFVIPATLLHAPGASAIVSLESGGPFSTRPARAPRGPSHPRNGSPRESNRYVRRGTSIGSSINSSGELCEQARGGAGAAGARLTAPGGWSELGASRQGSRGCRRRRNSLGPLFAEDQGWLDALKDVSGESGLPMGPKKVCVRGGEGGYDSGVEPTSMSCTSPTLSVYSQPWVKS